MTERPATPPPPVAPEVAWAAGAAILVVALLWAVPAAVTWLNTGALIPVDAALSGSVELIGQQRWENPAHAYPPPWKQRMPNSTGWWAAAAWLFLTSSVVAVGGWRRLERVRSDTSLGPKRSPRHGSHPRTWARSGDLDELLINKPHADRFTLGRHNGRLIASDHEAHVAVIAPTRSGKTTRCVIPWLLEHDGPAVVTSTKTDVLAATRKWREKKGQVLVWNPFGESTITWTPITGCEAWQAALSQAQWLADAAQQGDSEIATYWRGEAARLLAPLLHAAALGKATIAHVLDWVDAQNVRTPSSILDSFDSRAARRQLAGVAELDPRNRGTVYMSAGSLLAAYRLPAVQATAQHGFLPETLLDGGANTLYLIASSRQQRLLAPLLVALVSGVLNAVAEHANDHRALSPTLRVLLDETANIAPLRDLPAHLSQAAGHGVRIATVWQSIAQAQQRYGAGAEEILANSTAKLYLGPITDANTRDHITGLLGDERIDQSAVSSDAHRRSQTTSRTTRPTASASALQQLPADRALLIAGAHRPAMVDLAPWWQQRRLARRGVDRAGVA